jgi:hypothetical protein
MIPKVRMQSPQALEALLAQIHSLTGVTGTRSFIALSTYLDRPVQAEVTESWPWFLCPPTSRCQSWWRCLKVDVAVFCPAGSQCVQRVNCAARGRADEAHEWMLFEGA